MIFSPNIFYQIRIFGIYLVLVYHQYQNRNGIMKCVFEEIYVYLKRVGELLPESVVKNIEMFWKKKYNRFCGGGDDKKVESDLIKKEK